MASMAGLHAAHESRAALTELTRAHLIAEHVPGRFACHDLLRAYAAELASGLPEPERRAAIRRMHDHYLHTTAAASAFLGQSGPPSSLRPVVPESPKDRAGRCEAFAWFEAERLVLSAVISQAALHGFDSHARQLSSALREFYIRRTRPGPASAHRIALPAAGR